MILITGATGFIGQALIRQLNELGAPMRSLLRPSAHSPDLPRGVSMEVAVCSLSDMRGLRAAMVGVDIVFHLISGEWSGPSASLMDIDIKGTQAVLQAAVDARVKRFFFVSHLGADRASAYPVLKAKGISEEFIRKSGINYTILRAAIVYGRGDGLTTGVARLLSSPLHMFVMPGEGQTLLQPIWVEDLVTCMVWALEDPATENRMVEIGGPEYLPFRQIVELVRREINARSRIVFISPGYLRRMTLIIEAVFPRLPVSQYWLDYLAVNRTCSLDTVPRVFNLLPSRFANRLAYLQGVNWRKSFWNSMRKRR
jgi:uncharacterized protein YbjT (DUF2867 family)